MSEDISIVCDDQVVETKIKLNNETIKVIWDLESPFTPIGQLVYFSQFLETADMFSTFIESCPVKLTSNNAPETKDALGTLFLSILSGHKRYCQIHSLANDKVSKELMNLGKIVSETSARRFFKDADENETLDWLQSNLYKTYEPLLTQPYILDIDSTVKTIYGKQEGATVGYNPHKPGRPSYILHTYFIGNLRMVLGVDTQEGNRSASSYCLPTFLKFIDQLEPHLRPKFVRGDIGFGNEALMTELENRKQKYLFKVKRSKRSRELIRECEREGGWTEAGKGWLGKEKQLKLSSWESPRKVIVLKRHHRKPSQKQLVEVSGQMPLEVAKEPLKKDYAVLVTDLDGGVMTLAQHYRDRGDCENNFDELKNQWGWGGYTTTDFKRTKIMIGMTAFVYNLWSVFVGLGIPDRHAEASTSRSLILKATGKLVKGQGQRKIRLSTTHKGTKELIPILNSISKFLTNLTSTARQLAKARRWAIILSRSFIRFLNGREIFEASDGGQLCLPI